jgi:hypothetical protein
MVSRHMLFVTCKRIVHSSHGEAEKKYEFSVAPAIKKIKCKYAHSTYSILTCIIGCSDFDLIEKVENAKAEMYAKSRHIYNHFLTSMGAFRPEINGENFKE